jgi:hypothetical protein
MSDHETSFNSPENRKEQRTCKRVKVNMRLAYRDNENAPKMGKVCNISRGGMFVDTMNSPEVDGYVIASIDAENFGKIIWVQGHVVRKTNSGMAVSFARTDDKGLKTLLSYWCVPF